MTDGPAKNAKADDAAQAIRYLAIKAAIFIGVPAVAAAIAVIVLLNR